jgi:hypothetical protein
MSTERPIAILERAGVAEKMMTAVLPLFRGDATLAKALVESEKSEFARTLNLIKPEDLAKVPESEIYRVAISSVATGLSWAAEEKNFYLTTRNAVIGKDQNGKDVWGKNLELAISHYGETSLRIKQGIIKYLNGPYVVFDGDKVENLNLSKGTLDHIKQSPTNPKAKVIAVYIMVVMPDGRQILKYFDQSDFDRWAGFSRKQNTPKNNPEQGKDYANSLYTSYNGGIDPGFASGKCIKHAYKGLPKCKTLGVAIQQDPDEIQHQTIYDADSEVMPDDTPATPTQEAKVIPTEEETIF